MGSRRRFARQGIDSLGSGGGNVGRLFTPSVAFAGAIAGGIGSLAQDKTPIKTVGSYWPYATTLFDYVRRAMPFQESKSLTADELYAVSAYVLNLNGVIGPNDVIDAVSLPKVRMPNRDGFITFPRNPK